MKTDSPEDIRKLSRAIEIIETLRGGFAKRGTFEQVKKCLDELTSDHDWSLLTYDKVTFPPLTRARRQSFAVSSHSPYTSSRDFFAREASAVTEPGRCHTPFFSVFYAANNIETALSEVSPDVGHVVHCGTFAPKASASLRLITIGAIDHYRRHGTPILPSVDIASQTDRILADLSPTASTRVSLIDAFLAEIFYASVSRDIDYKLTAALSMILFDDTFGGNPIDGIIYPSVAHRGGMNYAIRGEKAIENLDLQECVCLQITQVLGFGLYASMPWHKSTAIDFEGNISWDLPSALKALLPEHMKSVFSFSPQKSK